MKVLMYGWEFPPQVSGGLGMACYGLTRALVEHGLEVTFVIPRSIQGIIQCQRLTVIGASDWINDVLMTSSLGPHHNFKLQVIDSLLHPYLTPEQYQRQLHDFGLGITSGDHLLVKASFSGIYGPNLLTEVFRYAYIVGAIARSVEHDIIHAHDWLSILAGVVAKQYSGKPLFFHVHALETDRSGIHINPMVFAIEKHGMSVADQIVVVSQYTKNQIIQHYGIPKNKIAVVYNGIFHQEYQPKPYRKIPATKMVLFVGRITHQKGPRYFVEAAYKICQMRTDIYFVMAGSGDLFYEMIEYVGHLRIGRYVHFTGFLPQSQLNHLYDMADVYVMPSVSEPFGLSCLEAISHQLPTIISKNSGVAELLQHVIKVDFWDTTRLASTILSVLDHQSLAKHIRQYCGEEIKNIDWYRSGMQLIQLYQQWQGR